MTTLVSALGDTALLGPASLAFLGYLLAAGRFAHARHLALTLGLGLGATLAAKLVFRACGGQVPDLAVASPSGHVAFATIVYGALAAAFAAGRPRPVGLAFAAAAASIALAVAASRVMLGYHSAEEVAFGAAIGLLALGLYLRLRSGSTDRPLSLAVPAIGAAAVLIVFLGRSITFEYEIARVARSVAGLLDICPPPAKLSEMPLPRP